MRRALRAQLLAWAGVCGLTLAASAWAASFDCQRAKTPNERAVCADAALSALDERMASDYQSALTRAGPRKSAVAAWQRDWLMAGDISSCNGDQPCLQRAYTGRQALLARVAPASAPEAVWTGRWRKPANGARTPGDSDDELLLVGLSGGEIAVSGAASWVGGDTANSGEMRGIARVVDGQAHFDGGGCTAMWRLRSAQLEVTQESGCGGLNVSFQGVYRRR
ncbi:lysozyme inhibitor LprI family protein [Ottowia testudinis]|uniref:Lysozyme inhibitor LprI N-terminal domain-containing protein n=1 Tax=Ottowia testudinis TaxID=2816950 RepID=A0A975CG05_9BURK|nr:hypothetical protein [Ottowia testudinis]QTD44182.1 hypothetical protein J1M35_13730 [Ottowia testudinis]